MTDFLIDRQFKIFKNVRTLISDEMLQLLNASPTLQSLVLRFKGARLD
jgi:hypothetical protein